jgi:broad specificity phosphatase PhoE
MPSPALLTLVRHGETSANVEGVWHGSIDTALTERGHAQAARVARHLCEQRPRPSALYCSPLQRARHTAEAIGGALGLAPRIQHGIAEYDLGAWEGLSYRELVGTHQLFERMSRDPDFQPGGGESPRQVATRTASALRSIAASHRDESVVIVAHGGALTLGLGLLLDDDPGTWRRLMDNCAVTELTLAPDPTLLSFNETAHLDGL